MNEDRELRQLGGSLFAGGGLLTGLASLIGASCCVLPIVLVQAGVSTALVAHLAIFAVAKPYLLAVTALLVVAGFTAAFWKGRRPRALVLALLVIATASVVAAYVMPHYERELLDWFRAR